MITDSFDSASPAIIEPQVNTDAPALDACVMTFSAHIHEFVLANYPCTRIGEMGFSPGNVPVYRIDYKGKKIGYFKTYEGGPSAASSIEDSHASLNVKKFVVFGGAGCLDKDIAHGKVMVPTEAYRDEGTSYHYVPAADYIAVKNTDVVAQFMEKNGIPFVKGKTWTTDAFYRETKNNFEKRKAEGCISVEMECAALQAVCDFRGLDFYTFFTSSDLLDAPEWDARYLTETLPGTQHDPTHFDLAIELAYFIASR